MNEREQMGMPGMETMGMPAGDPARVGMRQQHVHRLLALVVVLVVGGVWYLQWGAIASPKVSGEYQAVFLTNNQVYFGKVSDLQKQYVKLDDVYYLQLQQQPQPAPAPRLGVLQPATSPQQPQFTLLKLGQEIHGPLQEMWINRDQILLIEGLRDDSKVVQTIEESKDKEAAAEEEAAKKEAPVKKPTTKKSTK